MSVANGSIGWGRREQKRSMLFSSESNQIYFSHVCMSSNVDIEHCKKCIVL